MNKRHARVIRIGINSRRLTYTHSADDFGFSCTLDFNQRHADDDAYRQLRGRAYKLATRARERTGRTAVDRYAPGYHEAVAAYKAK